VDVLDHKRDHPSCWATGVGLPRRSATCGSREALAASRGPVGEEIIKVVVARVHFRISDGLDDVRRPVGGGEHLPVAPLEAAIFVG
jgi:hypothetical protein